MFGGHFFNQINHLACDPRRGSDPKPLIIHNFSAQIIVAYNLNSGIITYSNKEYDMKILMIITTLFLSPIGEPPLERYRALVDIEVCYKLQTSAQDYRYQEAANFGSVTVVECIKIQSL